MLQTTMKTNGASGLDPLALWYVSDRRIRTKKQARQAARIAQTIDNRDASPPPGLDQLFVAMQTCAFQAARPERGTSITPNQRRRWAQRWSLIRAFIVEMNIGLVHWMAHRMHVRYGHLAPEYDDLQAEGMLALTRAVDRFDPWRGFQFSTYASNVIGRAIMRSIQRSRRNCEETSYEPVEETSPVRRSDLDAEVRLEYLNSIRDENLAGLTKLELAVLEQRFPRDDSEALTFREIGSQLGLSKERVRQIQNEALDKLRTRMILDSAA